MVTKPPTLEELTAYRDRFMAGFPTPTSAQFLGFDVVEVDVEAGAATIDFLATDRMLNPAQKVQGGILTAMMDDTMGPLMHIMSAGRMMPSTTDIHTQFHRPGLPGPMRCTARITRMGATLCTSSAELFNDKGKLLASAIQTAMMLPFSPPQK